jgi:hypothetical protein
MVERVARGRIMVPAAAALTVMAAGMIKPGPADAAGRDTTMQIRVQVVERCRIRLAPSGTLDQWCGAGGAASQTPVSVDFSTLVERLARPPTTMPARPIEPRPITSPGQRPEFGRTTTIASQLRGGITTPPSTLRGTLPIEGVATPVTRTAPPTLPGTWQTGGFEAANRRAAGVVEAITERVRLITVAY